LIVAFHIQRPGHPFNPFKMELRILTPICAIGVRVKMFPRVF
jgi:hypothetical protein